MRGRPLAGESGQSLVELAIAIPVLLLILAGVVDLGRAYGMATETSDAARAGARLVAVNQGGHGSGLAAMCKLVVADLPDVKAVNCPVQVSHAPPFVEGTDFPSPTAGRATVAVYCGSSGDCQGTATRGGYFTEIDVLVEGRFSTILPPGIPFPITATSRFTTQW